MKTLLSLIAFAISLVSAVLADDVKSSSREVKSVPVLARVNGQAITEADLENLSRSYKLAPQAIAENREVLLERLIERQLLRQFLDKRKIAADPKRIDSHVNTMRLQLKQRGEDLDKTLAKLGLTEASLRRELSLPLDWDTYVRQQLTDAKLREIWQTRRAEFDGTEVRAAHIVLQSDQPDEDEKKLAALRADLLAKKITFAEAAKQHSQSPSAVDGGDLGTFRYRGRQPAPFPKVAFALKVDEVSQPFRSSFGTHLLTVTERSEGQFSLEDARPDIVAVVSAEWQRETVAQEKHKAKIERRDAKRD